MSVHSAIELNEHFGHEIDIARYGTEELLWNITIECMDCGEVLVEFDDD